MGVNGDKVFTISTASLEFPRLMFIQKHLNSNWQRLKSHTYHVSHGKFKVVEEAVICIGCIISVEAGGC